jgi:cytochrome b
MKTFLRIMSVLPAAIGVFLLYAVVAAFSSDGGAKVGVCIGYVVGAAILFALTAWMWGVRKARPAAV